MTESRWWVANQNQRLGPYSWAQLRQMADSGTLRPTDLVFQEGTEQWVQATSVPTLLPVLEVIPDEDEERPRAIVAEREVELP